MAAIGKLSDSYLVKTEEPMLDLTVKVIKDCLEAGMMADFLAEHGSEAVNMLYTEFNMEDALEVRFEEGVEKGIIQGEEKKLKELIEKKVAKGKTIETIAQELEETIEVIQQLVEQK